MSEVLIIGVGLVGATVGLFLGRFWRQLETPNTKILRRALEDSEEYYKTAIQRLKGRLKEYEQPEALQRYAAHMDGKTPEQMSIDLEGLLGSAGVTIPRWIRPFIGPISAWLKENPDKVQAVLQKFTQGGQGQSLNTDSL